MNKNWNEITEKGLPPVGKPLIVTIKDNLQGMPNQLRYPVYYVKDTMKNQYCWKWLYGDMAYDLLPEVSEVLAWQLMPEIFEQILMNRWIEYNPNPRSRRVGDCAIRACCKAINHAWNKVFDALVQIA